MDWLVARLAAPMNPSIRVGMIVFAGWSLSSMVRSAAWPWALTWAVLFAYVVAQPWLSRTALQPWLAKRTPPSAIPDA